VNSPREFRPKQPDGDLLNRARSTAAHILQIRPEEASWRALGRIDRPQSTLFRLSLVSGNETLLQAYCKYNHFVVASASHQSDISNTVSLHSKEATFRRVLSIGPTLSEAFAERSSGLGIEVPRVLATSTDLFADVQTAIAGSHPPRPWIHRIPGKLKRMEKLYCKVGQSITLFESLSDCTPQPTPEELPDLTTSLASSRQHRKSRPSNADFRKLSYIQDLQSEAVDSQAVVRAHGDISRDNLIETPQGLGVIDALWTTRIRGYDLAVVAARLAFDRQLSRRASDALTQALIAGYGDSEISSTPQWHLAHKVLAAKVQDGALAMLRYRAD